MNEPTIVDTIAMKTAQNTIVIGWLASQTDLLANDWQIYEPKENQEKNYLFAFDETKPDGVKVLEKYIEKEARLKLYISEEGLYEDFDRHSSLMQYFVSVKAKDEEEGLEKARQIIKTKSTIFR